jgi:DNA-binding CsgD family transcriptional regulator
MGTIPEVRGVHEARGERILDVMDPSGVRAEVRRSCRSAVDPLALYRDAAALLAPVVGFDRWCGLLLDPATLLNTGGYHEEGLPMEVLPRLLEIEVGEVDANAIPALGRSEVGVSTLDRATGGRPTDSRRFREVLEPAGLGREMRAVLRDRGSAWGGLVFFRETADSDFTDAGVALVADVGADLARAVRRCLLHSEHAHRDQPDGPGMALLRVEGTDVGVDMLSPAARRWLEEVADGRLQPSGLPLAVVTLVQRAVRAPAGAANIRLRARSGRWLTLYAEAMDEGVDDDREDPVIQRVSLVVEPTRPHELAEVICDAYALTPREREVARLAVGGLTNREIAAALWLSVYTVQDHLKAVFVKLGVRNRAELSSRMFFDHYLPRQLDGTPLGGDGWYVTSPGR